MSEAILALKEAAEVLGVHENTLRNWERQGMIRLIRLPGSRYRRAPREEVQRLATQMNLGWRPSAQVRRESPPTDPALAIQGQALARAIQSDLAALDQSHTLEETMRELSVPAAERDKLGRAYLAAAERLGLCG